MQKKAALGRGMNAILGSGSAEYIKRKKGIIDESADDLSQDNKNGENVSRETLSLRLSLIEPGTSQPRKNFDEESLKELADSIKEHGVLQPIIVRKKGQMYEIVVGERRWRAAKNAGLKEIPAIIKEMDNKEAAEAALIENLQREDLGSIEEARAYRALIDEYGLTQEELAERLSKSRTAITNSMRLLQLDEKILGLVESGDLTAGHARAILAIKNIESQLLAAKEVINKDLNVRQTEKLAKDYNRKEEAKPQAEEDKKAKEIRDMYITAVETELTESMKTKVRIRQTGRKKGKIEIEYYSEEELNSLIDRLR